MKKRFSFTSIYEFTGTKVYKSNEIVLLWGVTNEVSPAVV